MLPALFDDYRLHDDTFIDPTPTAGDSAACAFAALL